MEGNTRNNEEFTKDTRCLGLVVVVVKRQRVCDTNEIWPLEAGVGENWA